MCLLSPAPLDPATDLSSSKPDRWGPSLSARLGDACLGSDGFVGALTLDRLGSRDSGRPLVLVLTSCTSDPDPELFVDRVCWRGLGALPGVCRIYMAGSSAEIALDSDAGLEAVEDRRTLESCVLAPR